MKTAPSEELRERNLIERVNMLDGTRDDFVEHVLALKAIVEECASYVHYLLPGVDDVYADLSLLEFKEDLFDHLQKFDEFTRTVELGGRHKVSEMYFAQRDAKEAISHLDHRSAKRNKGAS